MKIRSDLIKKWIDEHAPYGMEKLIIEAQLSRSVLEKVRNGEVPKKLHAIDRLCTTLGISKSQLIQESDQAS